MKVVQSRFQGFIHRLSGVIPPLLGVCLILVISILFGAAIPKEFVKYYLAGLFAFPVLVTLWLLLFNSGRSSVDEYSFTVTDENLIFKGLSGSGCIPVSNYKGYVLKGWWPRDLLIFGDGKTIKITETIFSPTQINKIKKVLNELR